MKTISLMNRFKPDEVISGEWIMSGFRQCMDPGHFYFTRIRIVKGIEGHPDKVYTEPLDLWYRSDEGDEIRVWQMPDDEIMMERTKEEKMALGNEKEEKIYDLIQSCEPPYGLPLENELKLFISVFTNNCEIVMDEKRILSGIMKGDNRAVSTITSKYGIDHEELRQMTSEAFRDNQPKRQVNLRDTKPMKISYRFNSN